MDHINQCKYHGLKQALKLLKRFLVNSLVYVPDTILWFFKRRSGTGNTILFLLISTDLFRFVGKIRRFKYM